MKRISTISGLMLLLLFFCSSAIAQNITVKGKVTDASTGEGLPGVSIAAKGTTTGTTSDANGAYSISVSPTGSLTYSFIGSITQTIAVNGQISY